MPGKPGTGLGGLPVVDVSLGATTRPPSCYYKVGRHCTSNASLIVVLLGELDGTATCGRHHTRLVDAILSKEAKTAKVLTRRVTRNDYIPIRLWPTFLQ